MEVVTVRKMRRELENKKLSIVGKFVRWITKKKLSVHELIQQFLDTEENSDISVSGSCSYFQSCIVRLFI